MLGSRTSANAALLLEYHFNETGTTAASTGTDTTAVTLQNSSGVATDLHSTDTLGVSGLAGDRAFDNTASTGMGNAPATGGRGFQADQAAVDGLSSFTLAGWFKSSTALANGAQLFNNTSSGAGFALANNAGNALILYVDGTGGTSATYTSGGDVWTFFAVGYDGTLTGNNLKFYRGTTSTGVAQVGSTGTLNKGAVADDANGLTIGNNNAAFNRPYDGLLDNMRIFGSSIDDSGVVDLTTLESYRANDVLV
jgi:hypothetical protein